MMGVMTEDLDMFPSRIQTHQKLSEADKNRRKEMAKVLVDKIEESDTFLTNLWTTDEACHENFGPAMDHFLGKLVRGDHCFQGILVPRTISFREYWSGTISFRKNWSGD